MAPRVPPNPPEARDCVEEKAMIIYINHFHPSIRLFRMPKDCTKNVCP